MPKQLNIEDLLEILETTNPGRAPEFRVRLERLTQEAADQVALDTKTCFNLATWQGKAFGGCCCPFYAASVNQSLPQVFIDTDADSSGDWETMDHEPACEVPQGVGVFIMAGDKCLMSKRLKASSYVGFWQNPGGRVEADEDPMTTAVRELKEETGLIIDPARFKSLDTSDDHFPDGAPYRMHWFVVRLPIMVKMPPNPESDKHTDWEWMNNIQMVDLQQQGLLINSTFSEYVKALPK